MSKQKDVVIFLDSITRLARALYITTLEEGKILSGGVDANVFPQAGKRFSSGKKH
ncbi:MAG: hypothetical protein IPG09_18430 [Ignavibacteria bacterium]|nr:hypothetical protein [Ignavibacteria bacterium]